MSRAFGSSNFRRPHLGRGGHGVSAEVADLRRDLLPAFRAVEDPAGGPIIDTLPAATASLAAIGGGLAFAIVGQNFLQGQSFATASLGTGNAGLDFVAVIPGVGGNTISVGVIDSGSGGLSVAVSSNAITIDLGGATPDATTVAGAVNGDAAALLLVECTAGGTGAGTVVVEAATLLTGGAGAEGRQGLGVQLFLGGLQQTINAQVTATGIAGVIDDATGLAAGEVASVWVVSDAVRSNPMQITIAA